MPHVWYVHLSLHCICIYIYHIHTSDFILILSLHSFTKASVQMTGLALGTVPASNMEASSELSTVVKTFESGDGEESLGDESNDTSATFIPLEPQLSQVPKSCPADAGDINMSLDDMLLGGFDLKDAQATDLAEKFDFDVASSSSDIESAPMHAEMTLHHLSEDEKDVSKKTSAIVEKAGTIRDGKDTQDVVKEWSLSSPKEAILMRASCKFLSVLATYNGLPLKHKGIKLVVYDTDCVCLADTMESNIIVQKAVEVSRSP